MENRKFNDTFLSSMDQLEECVYLKSSVGIKRYIATVKKPSHLKIRGTDEKATIDLFVNGRLREKDILRHFSTSRIVESYAYGQIHFDSLDSGNSKDVFTSSREGIISYDLSFSEMLKELKFIFNKIIEEWDSLRRKYGNDGDPDNKSMPKKAGKAQELFNASIEDMKPQDETQFVKKGGIVEQWVSELAEEAQFNIPSYTECFISENLLRHYVKHTGMPLTPEAITVAEKWKNKETANKGKANISYDVRQSQDDICCPDIQLLPDIAEYFGVSVDELMGLDRKAKSADFRDISEEIKSLFRQADKRELPTLAFRLAALMHEGVSSRGYESIPWGKSVSESDDDRFKGWGGSVCAENEGETAYVGSTLFFSSHQYWKEISAEEINIIWGKLGKLSDKNSLKVLFAIYELTIGDIDRYVGIDEIADKSRLSVGDAEAALKGLDVSVADNEYGERYRLSGAFMYVPAMLRTLCVGHGMSWSSA